MDSHSVLKDAPLDYCPGCTHSHLHHLIAEAIDRFQWQDKVIGVCSSGCSIDMYRYFRLKFIQAPPGKAPAVASGIKCVAPDKLVFTYQGDGDVLSAGLDCLLHAAMRGENITIFCVNNLVMAAPGGQMSPTSTIGQVTGTTPLGRSSSKMGHPIKIAEIISRFPGVAFVQRVSLHEPDFVQRARLAIKDAFLYQETGQGLSFIEVLAMCPAYWHCSPLEAQQRMKEEVIFQYPVGIYKRLTLKS